MSDARVIALEAGISLQKSSATEMEETIQYMILKAPFDGTVVDKQGEVGEIINPMSMSASTGKSAVVTLASLEKMEVETDVAENLLSRIAIGQPAEVSVSAVPSKHYRGRLRQIIPMGDRARGTVKVKVEILDPDGSLFPELVATVHFLPDKALNNPNANRPFVFAVAQVGHLRGERPFLRLGRRPQIPDQPAASRSRHDQRRTRAGRVGPENRGIRRAESTSNAARERSSQGGGIGFQRRFIHR